MVYLLDARTLSNSSEERAVSVEMRSFTESVVEDAALAWLGELGYAVLHGPEIAAGEPPAERNMASRQ